ncbi:hypothetical protein CDL12_13964 [Handroanthus impetiginosus]|uniref:Pentacotripeptide-repeat region of PRORP domain-containing protein n=1 Tax=Handroanthus impetiginosus TaxID=429701 RepID=A0A2G9H7C1_9LAMI|nr:hypothetical protein CDL12_13964 [Handroanthus impetiginosus]
MKRVWRISNFQKFRKISSFCFNAHITITKPSISVQFIRQHVTETPGADGSKATFPDIMSLFSDKWSCVETPPEKELRKKVSKLNDEILGHEDDVEKIEEVLEENGVPLFRFYSDGSAVVELLKQLKQFPRLAMEVLNWRRKKLDVAARMTTEEYSQGIVIAGRLNNVDLAIELFKEASNKQLKTTSLFNALMSAYMWNGLSFKCQSLFRDLKMDPACTPSIITYNVLISACGRLMLVDHMETILREVKDSNLTPTVNTYKGLIAGYITAWMWEKMEKTYLTMKAGSIKPNLDIHLLMIRGYAISGKLEKMEEMYEMVKEHVEIPLIACMICAYCKKADVSQAEKIEQLLRLIPENEYKPWLNVNLIRFYAKNDLFKRMENSINVAFKHKTYVTTTGVMRCIISSYFRHNAVDKLADFVQRAECAGWKLCRSLYHCKMIMYGSQMRLSEMENVLDEMDRVNIPIAKKTFWILLLAYERWGQRSKLEQVIGLMCKHGYELPADARFS